MVFTYLKLITGVSTGVVDLRFRLFCDCVVDSDLSLIDLAFLRLCFSTIVAVGCTKMLRGVCAT